MSGASSAEQDPRAGGREAERRRERRFQRRRLVRVDPGGATALIADISWRGAFVLTSRLHEPGTRVRLTFSSASRQLQAEGLVRWVRGRRGAAEEPGPIGMGIEFVEPGRGA